jgi:hypothetical protein
MGSGTLLLMLPISTREGRSGLSVSLFTAASTVSLTGFLGRRHRQLRSLFGQLVLRGM